MSCLCFGMPKCDVWDHLFSLSHLILYRANEEIAQVRTKAKAESAALHAGLRKEQMKVESLERALQQKVKTIPFFLFLAGEKNSEFCLNCPYAPCTF